MLQAGGQPTPAAAAPLRLCATIESVDSASIVVKKRSGKVLTLAPADNPTVNEMLPIDLLARQPGAFIGTCAMPQPDKTLRAPGTMVFPESPRGGCEGHRPHDLQPGTMMTNSTVIDLTAAVQDRRPIGVRVISGCNGFTPPL